MKRTIDIAKDGVETLEVKDKVVRHTRVQDTDPYYAQNRFWRDNIDKTAVTRKGSWALPVGQIPYADYQNLVKHNPELASSDAEVNTKAWLKVLKSGICEQFRTVRKNLIPESMKPDKGSILLPSQLQKQQEISNAR